MLDEVDTRLGRGDAGPGFATGLGRAGVRYLLVRNDLDAARTSAPHPVQMRDALAGAPGVRLVKAFGSVVGGGADTDRIGPDPATRVRRYRALEVYEVADWSGLVATYDARPTILSGGPEDIFDVADTGAVVLAGDAPPPAVARRVVTDGLRRRDVDFGDVRTTASYTLTAHEPAPGTDRPPRDRLPVAGVAHQTTVRMTGAVTLRASSYGPSPTRLPELQPFAAFDHDLDSAWVPNGLFGPGSQFIEVGFDRPVDPRRLRVRLQDEPASRITRLTVSTDHGWKTTTLDMRSAPQTLQVPSGVTRRLRIDVAGATGPFGAGLREIEIPGVRIDRPLAVPHDQPGADGRTWMLRRARVDPYDATRKDEEPVLARMITTDVPLTVAMTGTARGRLGAPLNELVTPAPTDGVRVRATSTWKSLPLFAASSALDADATTGWVASPEDKRPTLTLDWPTARMIDSVEVTPIVGAAMRPTLLQLTTPDETRRIRVPARGTVRFAPVLTSSVAVKVLAAAPLPSRLRGLVTRPAVGVAELTFPGLAGLAPAPRPATVDLPCGQGPPVLVDGKPVATQVRGSFASLVALRPLTVEACEAVDLAPGSHRIDGAGAGALVIDTLTLAPNGIPTHHPSSAARPARILRWDAEHRRVDLGPGRAAWLTMSENFNRGWRASIDGHALRPVRVDGWRQGFVVPAGVDGTTTLSFGPGRTYRLGLALGAFAVLVLATVALTGRRGVRAAPVEPRDLRRGLIVATAIGTGFLVGGPTMLVAAPLALVVRRPSAPWIAGGFGIAGAIAALQPGRFPAEHAGAFSPVAQALTVLAVMALVLSLRESA
jgi:arabinofuranan 3-O-arabinosyltransferase